MIGLLGTLALGFLALVGLLIGVADLTMRAAEDFDRAGGPSKRQWAVAMGTLPAIAVALYLLDRRGILLTAVPAAWLAVEAAYLVVGRRRVQPMRALRWSRVARRALLHASLVGVAALLVFPLYVTAVNSLLRGSEITRRPPTMFPFDPQWDAYSRAWTTGHLGRYLCNSAVMTTMIVVSQVVTSVLSASAFAFLRFPFKRALFVVFLGTLMLPFEVTIVTNLRTVSDLGLYDTYLGMALPFLASGFGTFVMRQAFLSLPGELRDAATVDGYGHLRFLARVAVPLTRPSIAALTVFCFLGAWSQYLWPYLIAREDLRTVQIGVKELRNTQFDRLNVVFAGLVIAAVPLVILLIVFQKQLIRGLTAGAVKG